MQRISAFATAAALASQAIGAPAPQLVPQVFGGQNGFSIPQVQGPMKFLSGPLEMQKTYQKYNVAVPANVASAASAAAAAQQSGSVAANPESYDSSYLCPVSVGGQTLNLDFDTGSSDLWVFSTELPSSESSGHALYNPSSSSTSKLDSGETWDISYGDGSGASGNVYYDTVVVGGVTATSQAVEAAESVSSEFTSDTANDGLLGLAFPVLNTCSPNRCSTFFETVQSSLPAALFTADLKYHAAGSYDFGFINSAKYTGSITYTPVTQAEYWEFTPSNTFYVGSTKYSATVGASIADTGTTLLYLPATVVKDYYSKVSGATNSASAGGYIFPCSATLPSFSAVIGGTKFTVPGTYINYAPYSSTQCFGGIQSSAGIGFNIFGDIFLKSQVSFRFASHHVMSWNANMFT